LGKTVISNASTTNLTVTGQAFLNNIGSSTGVTTIQGGASTTELTVGNKLTVSGNSSLQNTNVTNLLASGYITAAGVARNGSYSITLPNVISSDQTGYGIASGWTNYSDARIKTDQAPIDYGLKEIMQLVPKRYIQHTSTFENGLLVLGNGGTNIGLIAQEVFNVIPEVVVKPTDETTALWSIDYAKFAPVLIRAIQEQQTEIAGLMPTNKFASTTDYSLISEAIKNGQVNMGDVWTIDRANGQIKSLVSLDMSNFDIDNVKAIKSASGNWSLTEDGVLSVKEVHTEKLCIGTTCVTEDELKTLLQTANVSGANAPAPSGGSGSGSSPDNNSNPSATSSEGSGSSDPLPDPSTPAVSDLPPADTSSTPPADPVVAPVPDPAPPPAP